MTNDKGAMTVVRCFLFFIVCCWSGCQRSSVPSDVDTEDGMDDSDTQATSPIDSNTTIEGRSQIGERVFATDQVLHFHIEIDPFVYEQMQSFGNDELYRAAALRVTGMDVDETFDVVGFRYKGAWTLHHCWDDFGGERSFQNECARLSTKIKFNKYEKDKRLDGLKRINLHAMAQDDTKLRERLAYGVFRDAGVDTSRVVHGTLTINDGPQMLVAVVEQIDGRFTAHRFSEGGDGNLYKEIWPVADLTQGEVMAQLRTNDDPEDNPDVSDFIAFGNAISRLDADNFVAEVDDWLDLTHFLRYLAVDRAFRNWDGITAFYDPRRPHNFYWYHSPELGRYQLIPWDMDNTMWAFDPFVGPREWVSADPVPDWNVKPLSCDPMPVWSADNEVSVTPSGCDPLIHLTAATSFDRFAQIGHDLLDDHLKYSRLASKLDAWTAQIRPLVADDPWISLADWDEEVALFYDIVRHALLDFQDHIDTGYIVEQPVIDPSPDDLLAVTEDRGLQVDNAVNNFEFSSVPVDQVPQFLSDYAALESTIVTAWNTVDPLHGTADVAVTVDFTRRPGVWNEYAGIRYATPQAQPVNVAGATQLSVTIAADDNRSLRVSIDSSAYDMDFGGVLPLFSRDLQVTATPTVIKIPLSTIAYPSWAKEMWTADQGWDTSDRAARNKVLETLTGVTFEIYPSRDASGEMVTPAETVAFQIDNLYFQ